MADPPILRLDDFILQRVIEDEMTAEVRRLPEHFRRRLLAECKAKRGLVGAYRSAMSAVNRPEWRRDTEYAYQLNGLQHGYWRAMMHVAGPYADHRDYRKEWRPDSYAPKRRQLSWRWRRVGR